MLELKRLAQSLFSTFSPLVEVLWKEDLGDEGRRNLRDFFPLLIDAINKIRRDDFGEKELSKISRISLQDKSGSELSVALEDNTVIVIGD